MARIVKEARLEIVWDDGHRADMGTLTIDANEKEVRLIGMWKIRQRIGWELVRTGFRIMMPGRAWWTKIDS